MVEWYQDDEELPFLENFNNTAIFDLEVTDEMNNASYTCVGTYPDGLYSLHTKLIVLGMLTPVVIIYALLLVMYCFLRSSRR